MNRTALQCSAKAMVQQNKDLARKSMFVKVPATMNKTTTKISSYPSMMRQNLATEGVLLTDSKGILGLVRRQMAGESTEDPIGVENDERNGKNLESDTGRKPL